MTATLIVNFGGPRSLSEIEPFLASLLTDRDVVRTKLPSFWNTLLFKRVAKKRAVKIASDYQSIGGKSPIYADTEYVAEQLRKKLGGPVLTFHRYLPDTHAESLAAIEALDASEIRVFPMFPQFTYATTGSIAHFFQKNLSPTALQKLKWVKSYPSHPAFVAVYQRAIQEYMQSHDLKSSETLFFFSPHGVPQKFIDEGDLYYHECHLSYKGVMAGFPEVKSVLAFQSKFGPGEWLRPYTQEVCENIDDYRGECTKVLFIPISFTSDHIETLFEVEQEYVPIIKERGLAPYRVPALNRRADWIEAIITILAESAPSSTGMLIR